MGKSYSVDLRLRVVSAIDEGLSKTQAHKTYKVSRSSIDDWLALREQTGSVDVIAPRVKKGGLHRQEAFASFVAQHPHCTLEQMSVAWQEQTQQKASLMSFSRALRALGYTRKKRVTSTSKDAANKGSFSLAK